MPLPHPVDATGPRPETRRGGPLAAALLAVVAALASSALFAAPPEDFEAVFGPRWDDAARFLRENAWIERELRLPAEDVRVALAVVFPEVVRFSALEDMIQVRGLKVLYVQYGRKYADFSIGRFQMKPSFAELLERHAARLFTPAEREAAGIPAFESGDTPALRERRVRRLDDLRGQVGYLRLFMMIMGRMYGTVGFADAVDRVGFYATAYNGGYARGAAAIRAGRTAKRFHLEPLGSKGTYCYADVAVRFFTGGAESDRARTRTIR